MGIHQLTHLLTRALQGVTRRPWLHLLSLVTLSAAFLSFAATLTTAYNLDHLVDKWSRSSEITVYLKSGVDQNQLEELSNAIAGLKGVARVSKVTATEARDRFAKNLGAYDDLIRTLPESTFPATVEVHLTGALSLDEQGRNALAQRISQVSTVNEVELYDSWFDRLFAINLVGQIAAWGLGLIALIVALLVVAAVIRSSMGARYREIEVLRLVGATERYVRIPFLIEGAFQGISAMILALVALHFALNHIQGLAGSFIPLVGSGTIVRLGPTALFMLVAGSAITGFAGANYSLKRQRAV